MQSLFGVYDCVKKEVVYLYVANNCEEAGRIFKKSLAGNEDHAADVDLLWLAYFDPRFPALYSDSSYYLIITGANAVDEELDVLTICRQSSTFIPSDKILGGDPE